MSRTPRAEREPPMEVVWAMVTAKATTLPPPAPSRKTGVIVAMSSRCPAQSQGSLVMKTSPGRIVSRGKRARVARVTAGMTMLKTGMLRLACATEFPSASRISQPKSWAAPMMVETAVRRTVVHMSSAMPIRRLHMISRLIGSKGGWSVMVWGSCWDGRAWRINSRLAGAHAPRNRPAPVGFSSIVLPAFRCHGDDDVLPAVDSDGAVGGDDDGGLALLDDAGTGEGGAGGEAVASVDGTVSEVAD